ncbi:MAG: hypothetical protein L6Q73_18400 [Aquabacterium sp.]|nr:hypothetical protein [Aquabacterium sp.]
MNLRVSIAIATACASLCLAAHRQASANDAELRESQPATGTSIQRKLVSGGNIPIRQTYAQLSEEHRSYLRSFYTNMPEADEPPFPAGGLIAIYRPISQVQGAMRGEGLVEMYVMVNTDGRAVSVSVYKTPDPATSEEIAKVLMLTEYKPALCAGKPCVMEFPFVVTLSRSL